jgi:hypothetical protein
MKEPSGEQVSLDFYFANRDSAGAMRDVVLHCLRNGASFSGEVLASEFEGARKAVFTHVYSEPFSVQSFTQEELLGRLQKDNVRLLKVGLWNAIGLTKNVPEIVTFNGMSTEASHHDTNPVAIVGEGWHFSTPGYETEALKDARRCFRTFLSVCRALDPDYAAILNEDSLSCQYDLRRGRGDDCFCNFFVSQRRYGSSILDSIQAKYADAYTERCPAGLYVATWLFSPKKVKIDSDEAKRRSKEVVQLIAK